MSCPNFPRREHDAAVRRHVDRALKELDDLVRHASVLIRRLEASQFIGIETAHGLVDKAATATERIAMLECLHDQRDWYASEHAPEGGLELRW